jgi:predicted dehydrogenase
MMQAIMSSVLSQLRFENRSLPAAAPNRRQFGRAAVLAAASASRVVGANDRIRLAAIGTGGRCLGLMRLANQVGNSEFVAVCDVYEPRAAQAKEQQAPQAEIVKDFRAVLDRKDVDSVIIGSPDHWHVPMVIAAVAAGKDVYCEKPLTLTIEEGEAVIRAVERSRRIVQVGYQQRSWPHYFEAKKLIDAGTLGKITMVEAYWYQNYNRGSDPPMVDTNKLDWQQWLGAAPRRAFDPWRLRRWRVFWDYGGGSLTDLYSHWVDTIHWFLGDSVPRAARATGGRYVLKQVECPDTVSASFQYAKGFTVAYEGTFLSALEDGGIIFRGTEATLRLKRSGFELYPEASVRAQKTNMPKPEQAVRSAGDGTLDHMRNFLECVRSRQKPNSDVASAVDSANAAHYGNMAYRTGETVRTPLSRPAFHSLFNGRDLDGWQEDTPGLWRVRDGTIIGKHSGLKYNDFLRTRRNYRNFVLKLEFRLVNDVGNSGIQFRSKPVPGSHEVEGYQADIGAKYWGCLYDESRRKRVLAQPDPLMLEGVDRTGWNNYEITARGNHITLELNGVRTVNYIEEEHGIERDGFIALQVHSGPGIEVHFRKIELAALD